MEREILEEICNKIEGLVDKHRKEDFPKLIMYLREVKDEVDRELCYDFMLQYLDLYQDHTESVPKNADRYIFSEKEKLINMYQAKINSSNIIN